MTSAGIDYSLGTANVDTATGIHYGVVHDSAVTQAWSESSEGDYGKPTCPKCGNPVKEPTTRQLNAASYRYYGISTDYGFGSDYACTPCKLLIDSEDAYPEEAYGFLLDDGEYLAGQTSSDIIVEKSPYYCITQFCSPCAPGAGYVADADAEGGIKAYCFDQDWYEGEDEPPFHIYRVADGALHYCPTSKSATCTCGG